MEQGTARRSPSLGDRWKQYAGRTFLLGNMATAGFVGLWQPADHQTQTIPARHVAALNGKGGHPPQNPDLCDVNVTYTGRVALQDRELVQEVIAQDESQGNTYHGLSEPQPIDRERMITYDASGRERDCTFFTAPDADGRNGDPDFGPGDVTLTMKRAVVFPGQPNNPSGSSGDLPDNVGFLVPWVNAQHGGAGYTPTPTPTPCPNDPPDMRKER